MSGGRHATDSALSTALLADYRWLPERTESALDCSGRSGESSRGDDGIETINLAKPLGPYSTAKRVGGFLFVSGQVGIDPTSDQLASRGIEAETKQVMENLRQVLESTKYSFSDVINATVYLKDMNDYPAMNAVYGSYFPGGKYPSRVAVEVSDLPASARIEISVVTYK